MLSVLTICVFALLTRIEASTTADLEAWVHEIRKRVPYSLAPGITAVVVSDGSSHTFGSGVQRLGQAAAADGDTLMEIGSLSKTMTALGLATLVTKGELQWDDPVQKFLGQTFALGPYTYVAETLTVRDLLSHRSGLAEGQGDFLGYFYPAIEMARRVKDVRPVHSLRQTFDYSNLGWTLAGQVLAAAVFGADGAGPNHSWCAAIHKVLLDPLSLTFTFCHRNEVPPAIASQHLAWVHKTNPCNGTEGLNGVPIATYEFVCTGGPTDFAYGAADAAGSVISSVRNMSVVMEILLGIRSTPLLARPVLDEMLTGNMVVPADWMTSCGIEGWTGDKSMTAGNAAAAGLGFDLAGPVPVLGTLRPYAEKNGDTNMHKARLGLFPGASPQGVLFLSNLGGSMGGPLSALKWGALTLLAGGSKEDADEAADRALNVTEFWTTQWPYMTTCNACRRSARADGMPCTPGGQKTPPLPAAAWTGKFGTPAYGDSLLRLDAGETPGQLLLTLPPITRMPLSFSTTSAAMSGECSAIADKLVLSPWNQGTKEFIAALASPCALAEWTIQPEIPAAGISEANKTVAFPWGCGMMALPDGQSMYVVSHAGKAVIVNFLGEALWSHA